MKVSSAGKRPSFTPPGALELMRGMGGCVWEWDSSSTCAGGTRDLHALNSPMPELKET